MENLWHYMRSHYWSNSVFKDYAALLDAATVAWRAVCALPEQIVSVCNYPYLRVGTD